MTEILRARCPGCAEERDFEQPPCADHGDDCPELACTVCGWGLVGSFELAAVGALASGSGVGSRVTSARA